LNSNFGNAYVRVDDSVTGVAVWGKNLVSKFCLKEASAKACTARKKTINVPLR
jgi:hypothetical protein